MLGDPAVQQFMPKSSQAHLVCADVALLRFVVPYDIAQE
jgi:hypothetical protein